MIEIIEQFLYVAAFVGQTLLIFIGVDAFKRKEDKLAGVLFVLGGVIGLNVLMGGSVVGFVIGPILLVLCILIWFTIHTIRSTPQEKRRYSRAQITLPVVVMTPDSSVTGVTQNLSLGGAFVSCSEVPKPDGNVRLLIKPNDRHPLLVNAEMVWSDTSTNEESLSHGMGLSFKLILDQEDRQFISKTVLGHSLNPKSGRATGQTRLPI